METIPRKCPLSTKIQRRFSSFLKEVEATVSKPDASIKDILISATKKVNLKIVERILKAHDSTRARKKYKGDIKAAEEEKKTLKEKEQACIRLRQSLHNYQHFMPPYRSLISSCLKGKLKIEEMEQTLNDWRTLRKLVILNSLFDKEMIQEYALLDISIKIMTFLAKPTHEGFFRTKSIFIEFSEDWKILERTKKDPLIDKLMIVFKTKIEEEASGKKPFGPHNDSVEEVETHDSSHKILIISTRVKRSLSHKDKKLSHRLVNRRLKAASEKQAFCSVSPKEKQSDKLLPLVKLSAPLENTINEKKRLTCPVDAVGLYEETFLERTNDLIKNKKDIDIRKLFDE